MRSMREMTSDVKEGRLRWLHRIARWAARTLGSLFVLLIALYLVALCDELYEARRAMRVYNQVLTVRLGDTVAEFNRKAPGCKVGNTDGESNCFVAPIRARMEARFDWYMMHAHENAYLWQNIRRQKIGLRDWYLVLRVSVRQGHVSEMQAEFFVIGRDMMLGCFWGLTPELRRASLGAHSTTQVNASTALYVTNITGSWSGWGYRMEFTPRSDAHDLRMREVNDRCLTSFTGCRDSRELLPNLRSPQRPR
jgi:hypothetical protein